MEKFCVLNENAQQIISQSLTPKIYVKVNTNERLMNVTGIILYVDFI